MTQGLPLWHTSPSYCPLDAEIDSELGEGKRRTELTDGCLADSWSLNSWHESRWTPLPSRGLVTSRRNSHWAIKQGRLLLGLEKHNGKVDVSHFRNAPRRWLNQCMFSVFYYFSEDTNYVDKKKYITWTMAYVEY